MSKLIKSLLLLVGAFCCAVFIMVGAVSLKSVYADVPWTGAFSINNQSAGFTAVGQGLSSTYDSATGYTKISGITSWGNRMYYNEPINLDGATISIYADGIDTTGDGQDVFGFSLGNSHYAYPQETSTKFCMSFWNRLWGQTRAAIGTKHPAQNVEAPGTDYGIIYKDSALTNKGIYSDIPEFVLDCTAKIGMSFTFNYLANSNVWKIDVACLYGSLWAGNATTVYVSPDNILTVSGSGATAKVYVVAFGFLSQNSTKTEFSSYIKIDDTASQSIPTATEGADGFTDISSLSNKGDRFYFNDKVQLDGLKVTVKKSQMPSTTNYFGFGFAKNSSDYPMQQNNAFNALIAPKLSADNKTDVLLTTDGSSKICYTDSSLSNVATYSLDYSLSLETTFSFNKFSNNVWKVEIGSNGAQPQTLYFDSQYLSSVLDADGYCYLVAHGYSETNEKASASYKVEQGCLITTIVDGVQSQQRIKFGGDYLLSQSYVNGKLNIGYMAGNDFYYVGDSVKVEKDLTLIAVFVEYVQEKGASVRDKGSFNDSGIMFISKLKTSDLTQYAKYISGAGMIILPTDLINKDKDFTFENNSNATILECSKERFIDDTDEYVSFEGALVNVKKSNHNRPMSGRAFIKLANGKYVYVDYVSIWHSRALSNVAQDVIKQNLESTDVINTYSDAVVNVVEKDGVFSLKDGSGRLASERVIQSVSGQVSNGQITLNVVVDTVRFEELLSNQFYGVTYNGIKIKQFSCEYTGEIVKITFGVPTKVMDILVENFYDTELMTDESVLLIAETDASGRIVSAPKAKLMFNKRTIVSLKWYYHNDRHGMQDPTIEFVEGVDFKYENGYIIALGSVKADGTFSTNMPYVLDKQITGEIDWPNLDNSYNGTNGNMIAFSENNEILQMQLYVSYTHDIDAWKGMRIAYQGDRMPNTINKLKNGETIKMFVYGDSVATGANTSGYLGNNPHMDSWMDLFAKNLGAYYGAKIETVNKASGGYTTEHGVNGYHGWINHGQRIYQAGLYDMFYSNDNFSGLTGEDAKYNGTPKGILKGYVPDLAVLRFGGNDKSIYFSVTPQNFYDNFRSMINTLRSVNPNIEIIIKAPVDNNPLASGYKDIDDYIAKLYQLAEEEKNNGVILVDCNAFTNDIYALGKIFTELSTNNINHPNDFWARTFAMNLLSAMIKPE